MLRITLLILMLLPILGVKSAIAQTTSNTKHVCKDGNLGQEKPEIAKAIKDFWMKFEIALRENDTSRIAGMVSYPLSVGFPSGNRKISSRGQFVKEYDRIFPKDLRAMLLRQRPQCVSRVGAKGFSVAEGQVWFDQYPDGTIKIFSINVVVYPGD